ncbi:MAG: hypothetical protein ACFFHV_10500, partial [Promethearchaeota archaeon]
VYFGFGLSFLFIQIGAFNLKYFALFMSISVTVLSFSLIYFIYIWEKNVINYKKIPTFYSVFLFVFSLINTILILVFSEAIFTLFSTLYVVLAFILIVFILALMMHFTLKVIGTLRIRALSCFLAVLFINLGGITDHPPVINIAPKFFMIFSPLILISNIFLWYYGLNGVVDGISSYYHQERRCIVDRGIIPKNVHIFYCPNCSAIYCEKCYKEVIKKDGCWICGEGFESTKKEEWQSIEDKSISVDIKNIHTKDPKE